ncbi:hypothetical protein SLEP1_g2300 [Rubroshorea leprosula]|uniref:Reverse transcriptase zinc-binding domain-containing protein n=1 Tax=Rubroshorea leprosula TaxID=152421 RepID=A0AAV5HPZ7_9ROSI|nr:hypothetical protein SLEP1_g2300 [Rubroshorea leprosula]
MARTYSFGMMLGIQLVNDAAIPYQEKVAVAVRGNYWNWPPAHSPQLVQIQADLCGKLYPQERIKDTVVWVPSASGRFHTGQTWHWLRQKHSGVSWFKLIWFLDSIPKHSFVGWLAILNRLTTKARQKKWTPSIDDTCPSCGSASETCEHMFFKCSFSSPIWQTLSSMAGTLSSMAGIPFHDSYLSLLAWVGKRISRKSLQVTLIKLAWNAAVYHIWTEKKSKDS